VAASTGDDPGLDSLLIRLHTETACRRAGGAGAAPEGSGHRPMSDLPAGEGRHVPVIEDAWVQVISAATAPNVELKMAGP
jgi:hypothetical protein